MFKKLLVFSLAFCLSLILLQFLKPHYETCPVRIVTNPTISNDSRPIQSDRQISISHNSSFKDLIQKFQNALAQDDKETIISLIKFPVNIKFIGKRNQPYFRNIKSENEFLLIYDKVFDDSFKKCISQIKTDNLLFSTSGEVFTWGNEIRMKSFNINSNDFEVKIIAIYRC